MGKIGSLLSRALSSKRLDISFAHPEQRGIETERPAKPANETVNQRAIAMEVHHAAGARAALERRYSESSLSARPREESHPLQTPEPTASDDKKATSELPLYLREDQLCAELTKSPRLMVRRPSTLSDIAIHLAGTPRGLSPPSPSSGPSRHERTPQTGSAAQTTVRNDNCASPTPAATPPIPGASASTPPNQGSSSLQRDLPAADLASAASVRVVVRCRPCAGNEVAGGVKVHTSCAEASVGDDERYTFDQVFDGTASQQSVYTSCVRPMIRYFTHGYNASLLAYGQTGSGKTHTLGCADRPDAPEDARGMIQRVLTDVFTYIENRKEDMECTVRISFVEIYNEKVRDLLNPTHGALSASGARADASIREDARGCVYISGIAEESISSIEPALQILYRGGAHRATGSHSMNDQSSRSHAVFTISLEQRPVAPTQVGAAGSDTESASEQAALSSPAVREDDTRDSTLANDEVHEESGDDVVLVSQFHIVDLAGSERAKRTQAQGIRFQEGIKINQSLLALGEVISALGDPSKRGSHVPYRRSKLTRLLKNALGGNSLALIIACISPALASAEETKSTLRYANHAKNIKNKPMINMDETDQAETSRLKREIARLRQQLDEQMHAPASHPSTSHTVLAELELENASLKRQLEQAHQRINRLVVHASSLVATARSHTRVKDAENSASAVSARSLGGASPLSATEAAPHHEHPKGSLTHTASPSGSSGQAQRQEMGDSHLHASRHDQRRDNPARAVTNDADHTPYPQDPCNCVGKRESACSVRKARDAVDWRDENQPSPCVMRSSSAQTERTVHMSSSNRKEYAATPHASSGKWERPTPASPCDSDDASDSGADSEHDRYNGRDWPDSEPQRADDHDDYENGENRELSLRARVVELEIQNETLSAHRESLVEEKRLAESKATRVSLEMEALVSASDQRLQKLESTIASKEDLIQTLVQNRRESRDMKLQYKNRIARLQKNVDDARREVLQVTRELRVASESKAISEDERRLLKVELEQKTRLLERHLAELQTRQREQSKYTIIAERSEKLVSTLQREVRALRSQQSELARERQRDLDTQRRLALESQRAILTLRKKLDRIESEKSRQTLIIRRKTEEIRSLRQRAREGASSFRSPAARSPGTALGGRIIDGFLAGGLAWSTHPDRALDRAIRSGSVEKLLQRRKQQRNNKSDEITALVGLLEQLRASSPEGHAGEHGQAESDMFEQMQTQQIDLVCRIEGLRAELSILDAQIAKTEKALNRRRGRRAVPRRSRPGLGDSRAQSSPRYGKPSGGAEIEHPTAAASPRTLRENPIASVVAPAPSSGLTDPSPSTSAVAPTSPARALLGAREVAAQYLAELVSLRQHLHHQVTENERLQEVIALYDEEQQNGAGENEAPARFKSQAPRTPTAQSKRVARTPRRRTLEERPSGQVDILQSPAVESPHDDKPHGKDSPSAAGVNQRTSLLAAQASREYGGTSAFAQRRRSWDGSTAFSFASDEDQPAQRSTDSVEGRENHNACYSHASAHTRPKSPRTTAARPRSAVALTSPPRPALPPVQGEGARGAPSLTDLKRMAAAMKGRLADL